MSPEGPTKPAVSETVSRRSLADLAQEFFMLLSVVLAAGLRKLPSPSDTNGP